MPAQAEAKPRVSFAESFEIIKKKAREFVTNSLPPNLIVYLDTSWDLEIRVEVPKRKKFLRWTYPVLGKNKIGALKFNFEGPKLAKQSNEKRWAFLVYGRGHVELFKTLAEQLANEFDVDIHVRLETEEPVELP